MISGTKSAVGGGSCWGKFGVGPQGTPQEQKTGMYTKSCTVKDGIFPRLLVMPDSVRVQKGRVVERDRKAVGRFNEVLSRLTPTNWHGLLNKEKVFQSN